MKNWKFIKVGNSDKEFKSEQELRRWAIDHQYTYKPTHGGYYMLEDDSGKGREPLEAHVTAQVENRSIEEIEEDIRFLEKSKSDYIRESEQVPKLVEERLKKAKEELEKAKKQQKKTENKKTGNKRYFTVEEEGGNSQNFSSLSEARKFADKWRSEGKQTIHIFEIEENDKDPDDFRIVRTHNESINKQTWSLFKGLSKDAEKEVGNKVGNEKISYPPEKLKDVSWVTLQYIIIHPEKYDEKTVELAKKIYANRIGNKKTGNQSAQDKFIDDINGIKAKYKQEGKELNLSRLMYELKRIGWAESDFTKLKWPANIGNTAHSDKVEVIKRLLAGGWSVEDIYSQLKTEGYEVEKGFVEKLKTGNTGHWNSSKTMYAKWDDATGRPADEYAVITWLGEGKGGLVNIWKGHQMTSEKYGSNDLSDLRRWAEQRIGNAAVEAEVVARDVVDGKEYIVEKTSLRNGQDVQFNLYYSMDGSGKRHAGVFKDKDSAVSAGKKIVGNETAEEKKFGHVMREFDRGELKSSSGETVTNPEQAKAIAYSESEKVNNLKRARNSMAKNAMGVSDLEAQIKKNKEFIRQQKMRMNGKSKPEQDDIAEGIREAQDEIDRMEMRIAELKEQGNNKKA